MLYLFYARLLRNLKLKELARRRLAARGVDPAKPLAAVGVDDPDAAIEFVDAPWAKARKASTYFSMTGPLSSWRASAASASKWMATSLLPRTMRAPSCLRSSISFSFNTDGMRTDRSKFLPFNERTSTVYFLEPTAPSAFPYPVIERSMPRRYAPTPWGPFHAGRGAVLPGPGATFGTWRNLRQAFDTFKRF